LTGAARAAWVGGDTRVGPYRILRLVNRGGQGSVYLGYDKRLHRRVAIKIYPLPASRVARKRLRREAQLVASLQSPKVVQIHDVIESPDHLAMVMEYVPGCDLEEFLATVRPSLASVLTIAADVAGALTVARQHHIVHGDLKPANVLITASGRAKLADFGIARRTSDNAGSAGSLCSISPEQYLGRPTDERSDLFALGCLLYRMLAGVQPFHRDGRLDGRALLEQAPAPLEDLVPAELALPPELSGLVGALLQKNPAERPANTRIVRRVLRRVARAIPLSAGNSLLREARPCFRPESAEDIPPPVPAGLGREGRSRLALANSPGVRAWRRVKAGARSPAAVAAAACVVAGIVYLAIRPPAELRVHFPEPRLRLAPGATLPRDISGNWLVSEVAAALRERLGPLRVTGPVGATPVTTLYADRALREPPEEAVERVQLELRCVDLLCVLAVTRNWQGQQANRQAVLFPDMSAGQWRDIVRATTLELYP